MGNVIGETLANTLTMRFHLEVVALKDAERVKTAEATLRDVHLLILAPQKKRNPSYAGIFPKALALKETTASMLTPPLQFQVRALLPQPLWSQQSLQISSLPPQARQLSFRQLGDQRLEHRLTSLLQRNLASSPCVMFFLVAPYTGQTIYLRSSSSIWLRFAPFRKWTGHPGMRPCANLQNTPTVCLTIHPNTAGLRDSER